MKRGLANPCRRSAGTNAGFTLIELLMVAALIIFLVGGGVVALRRHPATDLRMAEQLVVTLIGQAQSLAQARQAPTRLVMHATGSTESGADARTVQVLCAEPNGDWVAAGPVVRLPRGIVIVPPARAPLDPAAGLGERSNLAVLAGADDAGRETATRLYAQFEPDGGLADNLTDEIRIVLAAFRGSLANPSFVPETVRIIRVDRHGSITLGR